MTPAKFNQFVSQLGPDEFVLLELCIPWQPQSQRLLPGIAKLATTLLSCKKIVFCHVDVARYPEFASKLGISNVNATGNSIPALILYKGPKEIKRSTELPTMLGADKLEVIILLNYIFLKKKRK